MDAVGGGGIDTDESCDDWFSLVVWPGNARRGQRRGGWGRGIQLCQKTDDDADCPQNHCRRHCDNGRYQPAPALAWPFTVTDWPRPRGWENRWGILRGGLRPRLWRPRRVLGRCVFRRGLGRCVFRRPDGSAAAALQCPIRRPSQCACASVPVIGFFGHAPSNDVVEGRRNLRIGSTWSRRRGCQVSSNDRLRRIDTKRHLTRKRFVQNACQGVYVYCGGDLLVGKPFRRHVCPGTDLGTIRREAGVAHHLGDAEID